MAQSFYLPDSDELRVPWDNNFALKLPAYQAKYKLTDEDVKDVLLGAQTWAAVMNAQKQIATYGTTFTAFKLALRNGLPQGAELTVPVLPVLALPKVLALPGIFARVATVVNTIKNSPVYTVADGHDLGIEGTEIVPIPVADLRPVLAISQASGGHPDVKWKKQGMKALEIQVDRGEGKGWEMLVISTQAHFVDTHALPAAGQSAIWKYRAIYRDHDLPTGQWSEVAVTTVMG